MYRGSTKLTIGLFNIFVLFCLLSPLIVVMISSFGNTAFLRFPPQGWTVKWYVQVLGDAGYIRSISTSIYLATIACVGAVFVAFLAAWCLARFRVRGESIIQAGMLLPLAVPNIVIGVAILTFTQPLGMNQSVLRLIAAHVLITIPYAFRILYPVILDLQKDIEEAAADLGARPAEVFRTVTIPLLVPALLSAVGISFMVSFDELVIALFLAPTTVTTFPMKLYFDVEVLLAPTAGAVSSLLLVITFILAIMITRFSTKGAIRQ